MIKMEKSENGKLRSLSGRTFMSKGIPVLFLLLG
jgi:hypothetical protein